MNLNDLLASQFQQKPKGWKLPYRLMAIDPGLTTGFSIFDYVGEVHDSSLYRLNEAGIIVVNEFTGWDPIIDKIQQKNPSILVLEDYRIYASKSKEHTFSRVDTIRIIGAIEFVCKHDGIPLVKQMAGMAKGFVTDEKLKEWGLYKGINRHARDSVRHAIYFMLFNKSY